MLSWLLLLAAIVTEVAATVALKLSDGFTKWIPSSVVVLGYAASFYFLALLLTRGMSLGIMYAVWSAIGVSLIVAVDVLWFGHHLSAIQVAGLCCVVLGVAALELGGAAA